MAFECVSNETINATKQRARRLADELRALPVGDWRRVQVGVDLQQAEHDLLVATGYRASY
jgi:hypothetical protein